LIADGTDFVSRPVETLTLDFAGIVGDHHAGLTRKSSSREPWYPRGTELRNDRQLTIVSSPELAEVALAMELPSIEPGWIGANLVFDDIPDLAALPPGTKLLFAGGATLTIEAANDPCRRAGRSIAAHFPARQGLELLFPKVGRHKRGLVASVEKPGTIAAGEAVKLMVPARLLASARLLSIAESGEPRR
ncbi:MAG: MOSC domain-containing protein, partial [Bauldia sp.]